MRPNSHLHQLIVQSCHSTLIRLGDLSRYRETELHSKERNWGPAKGYYDLATSINPTSGASYNQLAVIAFEDRDHLRAVYHLHRALSVDNPFPTAQTNLELEFKKISDRQKKQTLIPAHDAGKPGVGLQAWFVAFHASCFKGIDFKEHGEMENEILSQLAVDLKERPLDSLLTRFCLISIAAESLARARAKGKFSLVYFDQFEGATERISGQSSLVHSKSILFLQQFNVKSFFTLLQILLPELEQFATEDELDGTDSPDVSERLTAVARRILPNLRNYSTWLVSNYSFLLAQDNEAVVIQIEEFWRRYAEALTLLTTTFPIMDLPKIDYLLEEDQDTIAFSPLMNEPTKERYRLPDGHLKPKIGDKIVQRLHPNEEMLARVRDLVKDGIYLIREKVIELSRA